MSLVNDRDVLLSSTLPRLLPPILASMVGDLTSALWAGVPTAMVTDGIYGTVVRRSVAAVAGVLNYSALYPIDRTRIYRTRFWARASATANGTMSFDLQQFTANSLTAFGPTASGKSPLKPSAIAPHTDWREYDFTWVTADWQAGVTHVRPDFLLNTGGSAGYWEVQAFTFTDATDAARAFTLADTANTAAGSAVIAATAANNLVQIIVDDAVLSRDEKPQLIQLVADITNEYAGILAQATTFGITTEKTDYTTYYNALNSYLPAGWNALGTDTSIVRTTFQTKFNDYYKYRSILLNKTADEASKRAVWASGIAGRPADSALLNSFITLGGDGLLLGGGGGGGVTLTGLGQKNFRVIASGGASTSTPATAGLYLTGSMLASTAGTRSYTVAIIVRSTGSLAATPITYDVWNDQFAATSMAAALNALGSDKIVVIITSDEPANNRLLNGLPAAMYRCGASRAVFGSTNFLTRSAYILVGIPGCGEGNGAEAYQGAVVQDANAWCDLGFNVLNGNLVGVSSSYTPKSLTDYGYTGDLNASSDITLLSGNMRVTGNNAIKISGSGSAFDAAVSSKNSYTAGAYCSAVMPALALSGIMIGLSTNPLGNNDFNLINYAIYVDPGAHFEVYELGVSKGVYGSYAVGDVISVLYDNASVSYLCNGDVRHTHKVATHSQALYFDSSFRGLGDNVSGIRFGPMSNAYQPPRAGTATTDSIFPDPTFKDLSWWNRFGSTVGDWSAGGTPWKLGASLYLNANANVLRDTFTGTFPQTPGATYYVEFQAAVSSGFAGQASVYWFSTGESWISMGAPNLGTWSSGPATALQLQFNGSSPTGIRTFSMVVTLSASNTYNTTGQIRIVDQISAGTLEIGSISITRMADSALIPDGVTINNPVVNNPTLDTFSISAISDVNASVYKPPVIIATIYPSVTGGRAPFRFDWAITRVESGDGDATYTIQTVTNPNDKLTIRGVCLITGGAQSTDVVSCTATDANGRTSTTQFNVSVSG